MAKPKMVHVEVYRSGAERPVFVCEVSDRFPLSEILKLTVKTCRDVSRAAALVPKEQSAKSRRADSRSRDTVGEWFKKQRTGDELTLCLVEEQE